MSETLSVSAETDITSLELDQQSLQTNDNQSESTSSDHEIPIHVQPLIGFVVSNGAEARLWPWGVKGSLRESIWSHPLAQSSLTIEEVPIVMADILEGLAGTPIVETEEPEELENEDVGTEELQKDTKESEKKEEKQEKVVPEQKISAKPDTKPAAKTQATTVEQPQQPTRVAEAPAVKSDTTEKTATPQAESIAMHPERIASTNESATTNTQDTVTNSAESAPTFTEYLTPIAYSETGAGATGQVKVQELDLPDGEVTVPNTLSNTEMPQPIFQEAVVAEQETVPGPIEEDGALDPDQELQISHTDVTETETELPNLVVPEGLPTEFQTEINSDNINKEVYLEELRNGDQEIIGEPIIARQPELPVSADPSTKLETSEESFRAQPNAIPEQVAATGAERADKANLILEKISEVSAKQDVEDKAHPNVQEQLEKLFVELLENLKINYTPELIESLVLCAANNGNWQEETMKLIDKKQSSDQPQGYGTNEAISQMLTSGGMDNKAAELGSMLGAMACALAI